MSFDELHSLLSGYVVYKPDTTDTTKEQLLKLARKHSL